ncbi:hypothetical protein CC2G_002142 [Coprinopsis cinerea AmutBmut pab1-1]|nr:hypothetical protein CC2G_002142 [Coprinopsis cinerea AmutBmut pab1-1]
MSPTNNYPMGQHPSMSYYHPTGPAAYHPDSSYNQWNGSRGTSGSMGSPTDSTNRRSNKKKKRTTIIYNIVQQGSAPVTSLGAIASDPRGTNVTALSGSPPMAIAHANYPTAQYPNNGHLYHNSGISAWTGSHVTHPPPHLGYNSGGSAGPSQPPTSPPVIPQVPSLHPNSVSPAYNFSPQGGHGYHGSGSSYIQQRSNYYPSPPMQPGSLSSAPVGGPTHPSKLLPSPVSSSPSIRSQRSYYHNCVTGITAQGHCHCMLSHSPSPPVIPRS